MGPDKKRKRNDAKSEQQQQQPKKPVSAAAAAPNKKPKTEADYAGPAVVTNSTLKKSAAEETSFPRGGASALTPLEYKEVANEAAKDVLFEAGGGAARKDGDADGVKKQHKKQKPRKHEGKKGKSADEKKEKDTGPRVEGFSYKRLIPGTLVLGCVEKINKTDIAVSLPNSLTGYIPITQISEKISARLEALAAESESEDEDGEEKEKEDEKEDDLDLESYFRVGQYLRAHVLHSTEEVTVSTQGAQSQTKTKKRIELSLLPKLANTGLTGKDLSVGCTVQATVASVEDHGLIMDLGLESDLKGFLALKELGPSLTVADMREGQPLLCTVTGLSSNGKIVKLSADLEQKFTKKGKLAGGKAAWWLAEASTVDTFLPGTGIEILVTDVGKQGGVVGKIMGMVDAVADYFHVAGWEKDLEEKIKAGSKIKARITGTFPESDPKKVSFSLLPHILQFCAAAESDPLAALPIGSIIDTAKVIGVESKLGLFVDVGIAGVPGFVHISRISSEEKVDDLSKDTGKYKIGSTHQARILGFNPMDGLFVLSTEKRVLEQTFLRIEDVKVGTIVKGKVEQNLERGGLLVKLSDGINGYVEEEHVSDVKLKNPEKKFRPGTEVKARVLAVSRRKATLTLKKTLVNSDKPIIDSYDVTSGTQSVGTIVKFLPRGAVVKFYNNVSAYLPVSEMSEAFIHDPAEHFKLGQSIEIHVQTADPEAEKMRVSCKDPSAFGEDQKAALAALQLGQIVSGKVSEKNDEDIVLELEGVGASGLKGILSIGHLTDGSREKNMNTIKKIRAGQGMKDLVVLDKNEDRRMIYLSNKPSLVESAKNKSLPTRFEDLNEGMTVRGFVRNVGTPGVFVSFAGGVKGLVLRSDVPEEKQSLPNFGYVPFQSVEARVVAADHERQRIRLSLKPAGEKPKKKGEVRITNADPKATINPVDGKTVTVDEYTTGKLTKAKVTTVQETQINVSLADNVQGRIDVSQLFEKWEDIPNRKVPLQGIKKGTVLDVRVIGIHDARNHRFLAITHRVSNTKTPIFELSAKPSHLKSDNFEVLTLDKVTVGSEYVGFVNSITPESLWVNLTPSVRGRIRILDLTDDVSKLRDVEKHYPIGSAIKCHVISVDTDNNRLDLSAKSTSAAKLDIESMQPGMVIPGRVVNIKDNHITVSLSDNLFGYVNAIDMADDFDKAGAKNFTKNDVIRVCVLAVDKPNKRITLSTRPSKVMDSSLPVRDTEVTAVSDVKERELRRGFVKNVSDKGLFISLGQNVTAWVKVSDLSDGFIKEWKNMFKVGQVVEGRVLSVDIPSGHIQMSLRPSAISGKVVRQKGLEDFKEGQIVTGKIKAVETYGVFVIVDGTNVSGLCHRSEIADRKVADVTKLYTIGDAVKAKVLKVDTEKRRISFGLKASYFQKKDEDEEDEDMDVSEDEDEDSSDDEGGVELDLSKVIDVADEDDDADSDSDAESDISMPDAPEPTTGSGLTGGGFDFSGNAAFSKRAAGEADSDSESSAEASKPRKKRKSEDTHKDLTGTMISRAPESETDYERLLLGSPNDSALWIQYMAFELQLSELEKAREIAERALKTINQRDVEEKKNVWIAMLNMENAYGDEESLEETFKRAVQYNDAREMHETLASMYISSGKTEKADTLFQTTLKKFSQSPITYLNYISFLFTVLSSPTRARELLKRALQALPSNDHREIITKFAKLEFSNGDPERGRTLFENMLKVYAKRMDLWMVYAEMEYKYSAGGAEGMDKVRDVWKRALADEKCGDRQAAAAFRRWKEMETAKGDEKAVKQVEDRARAWMEKAKARKE